MIMKTSRFKLWLMISALFSAGLVASCSDDDSKDPVVADKAALMDKIDEAEELISTTEEGTLEGQFLAGSKTALQTAINAAQGVVDNEKSTQAQVNSAAVNLQTAMDTYNGQQIAPIDEANLVGRWRFDEGTGTVANDDTDNEFHGTFKTGHDTWGAGVPEWTTDRFGDAGKAISFNNGANIEVPYNTALNPTTAISISIWVKADEVRADNRFLGLHSWVGYKFQLQNLNHAFFSVGHADGTYDKDGQVPLPLDEWHHLVATSGGGSTIIYLDGVAIEASTYNDTPNPPVSIAATPYNLVFGQDFPTDKYAETTTNFDTDKIIPLEWGGYFHGSLDEIRIYKSALTAAQVLSIYNSEKP